MEEEPITSAESLTEAFAWAHEETITLTLGRSSDLTALKGAVEAHSSELNMSKWILDWSGDTNYRSSLKLLKLFESIGNQFQAEIRVTDRMPFQSGDILKLVNTLLPGQASRLQIDLHPDLDLGTTKEEVENELLLVLDALVQEKDLSHLSLNLALPIEVEPKGRFLSTLAEVLPNITLKEMFVFFQEPHSCISNDQVFVMDLERTMETVQNGLEKNYTLVDFFIGLDSGSEKSKLWHLLAKLNEEKLWLLLTLNQLGRGLIESLPFHRDTWLEIVARYTKDNTHDAVFYYLRKNTWMFTHEVDLEAQNRRLVEEMKKCQQENGMEIQSLAAELGAEKKRHKVELGTEKKRCKAELGAEKKRHKAELRDEKKRHKSELKAKDQEIQKLQAQLSKAKTMHK